MGYGGLEFDQVLRFQIGCMMSNQYPALVQAIHNNSTDDVIVACLRLGWNDAFKHVSENDKGYNELSDAAKVVEVQKACNDLVEKFKEYAQKRNTEDRYNLIDMWMKSHTLNSVFSPIKNVTSSKYPLCFGHIQKMFNIAMKLLLCLIVSAEHANVIGIKVKLGEINDAEVCLIDYNLLSFSQFPYAFDTADCPVDHYILEAIDGKKTNTPVEIYGHKKFQNIVWSKMGEQENQRNYLSVQQEISSIQHGTGKCNLCFDFENWK